MAVQKIGITKKDLNELAGDLVRIEQRLNEVPTREELSEIFGVVRLKRSTRE